MESKNPISNSILVKETKTYLAANKGRLKDIAKGAGVSPYWIYQLNKNGNKSIKNPSAEFCEKVLRYAGYQVQVIKPKQKE